MSRTPAPLRQALPAAPAQMGGRHVDARAWVASIDLERLGVLIVLVVALLARLPTLGSSLDEYAHPFRQTQTAYMALLFHERGIDLFHAQLPVLGPPFEVPLEFPLFQAAASLVMDAGVPTDLALRLTALACFAATALLLWALVRRVATPLAAMAALVLFVAAPFGLVWSRAELIEYLATAGALAWVLAGIHWRERGGRVPWLIATIAGCVALLVKVTTGIFWILPLLAYRPAADGRRRLVGLGGMVLVPLALAVAWTRYGDGIKAASPLTAWLTSGALVEWNFGTLAQRADPTTWSTILLRASTEFGLPLFVLFVVGVAVAFLTRTQRFFWIAIVGTTVLPVVVFFNLYFVHDYYLIAISPGIAMVQGLLIAYLVRPLPVRAARAAAAAGLAALLVISISMSQGFWSFLYRPAEDPDGTLAQAAELARSSQPTDLALVEGRDWSPQVLYEARREGLAVPTWLGDESRADLIDPSLYRVASITIPSQGHMELLAPWAAVGAVGRQTYRLGGGMADMQGAGVIALDAKAALDAGAPAAATALTTTSTTIPCDGSSHGVPVGAAGTWLWIGGDPPSTARISVGSSYGPVPARRLVLVDPSVTSGLTAAAVACHGAPSLVIERIEDAPLPVR